jgi:hypothetical protein
MTVAALGDSRPAAKTQWPSAWSRSLNTSMAAISSGVARSAVSVITETRYCISIISCGSGRPSWAAAHPCNEHLCSDPTPPRGFLSRWLRRACTPVRTYTYSEEHNMSRILYGPGGGQGQRRGSTSYVHRSRGRAPRCYETLASADAGCGLSRTGEPRSVPPDRQGTRRLRPDRDRSESAPANVVLDISACPARVDRYHSVCSRYRSAARRVAAARIRASALASIRRLYLRHEVSLDDTYSLGLYDPPRSIVDAYRLRHEVGPEVANEALRRWLRGGGKPVDLIRMTRAFPAARAAVLNALQVLT